MNKHCVVCRQHWPEEEVLLFKYSGKKDALGLPERMTDGFYHIQWDGQKEDTCPMAVCRRCATVIHNTVAVTNMAEARK